MCVFPLEFLLGVATSACQIEGGWNEDGKGESIWDHRAHTKPGTSSNLENADIACDSYHLYKEDVKLIKDAGFNLYRFSVSWTRILPNGEITSINQKGIDYYHNLIDELLKNYIQPLITIYHWDLPQKLQDIGGWVNPLIVDYIEDFADVLFQHYGDKVKWWITINEPYRISEGYSNKIFAPALDLGSPVNYIVMHNVLKAHSRIYRLYDKKYRSQQNGKLSICLDSFYYERKTNSKEDSDAASRALQFQLDLFTHPIYSKEGGYSKIVRELIDEASKKEGRKRSRLPIFTEEEKQSLKGANDYFSLNHYTSALCAPKFTLSDAKPSTSTGTLHDDMNVTFSRDPKWPSKSSAKWLTVVPYGLRRLLNYIKDTCDNPPVLIAENGYADEGQLEDMDRISYHKEYLKEMLNAINIDKCNVIGYTVWSLLDNFEWYRGYEVKFGLIHVDFNDKKRKRTPKSSFYFFKELIAKRMIPE